MANVGGRWGRIRFTRRENERKERMEGDSFDVVGNWMSDSIILVLVLGIYRGARGMMWVITGESGPHQRDKCATRTNAPLQTSPCVALMAIITTLLPHEHPTNTTRTSRIDRRRDRRPMGGASASDTHTTSTLPSPPPITIIIKCNIDT